MMLIMFMRGALLALVVLGAFAAAPARAFDFPRLAPLDEEAVDPAFLDDMFGVWELRDKSGKKRCQVTLHREMSIGGRQIEVAPGCAKIFPVMDDITAWRLNQGWTIDLVDALRKTRLRLETPDERYIAVGDDQDVAGIETFVKVETKKPKKK